MFFNVFIGKKLLAIKSLFPIISGMQEYPLTPSFYQKHLAWFNWTIATFFCLFQFFLQASASIMVVSWMQDFHLNAIGISKLSAAFFYAYALMQIPVGFLNDHFSPKRVLTLGAFLVAAGCLSMAYTQNTTVAYIDRILMGIGSSFGFVSMLYTCSRWFQANKFAFMVGISESFGMVGVGIITVSSAWLLMHIGWRNAMLISGILATILMLAAHLLVRDKPIETTSNTVKRQFSLWQSLSITLKQPQIWLAGLYGFFAFSIVNAITSLWGVPFLQEVYHLSVGLSASIVSMILYGLAVGLPTIGIVTTKLRQRKPVMLVGSSFTALVLSIILFTPHLPVGVLFVLFFLTGVFGSSYIHCFSIGKENTPEEIHGISLAVINMFFMVGAPLLQICIGFLITHHFFHLIHSVGLSYRLALGLVPIGIALSFFIALLIKEKSPLQQKSTFTHQH